MKHLSATDDDDGFFNDQSQISDIEDDNAEQVLPRKANRRRGRSRKKVSRDDDDKLSCGCKECHDQKSRSNQKAAPRQVLSLKIKPDFETREMLTYLYQYHQAHFGFRLWYENLKSNHANLMAMMTNASQKHGTLVETINVYESATRKMNRLAARIFRLHDRVVMWCAQHQITFVEGGGPTMPSPPPTIITCDARMEIHRAYRDLRELFVIYANIFLGMEEYVKSKKRRRIPCSDLQALKDSFADMSPGRGQNIPWVESLAYITQQ